jgi:ribose transport system permease protein
MSDTNTVVPVSDTEPLTVRLRDVGFWADWAAVVGLIVLCIVFFIATPAFLTVGNVEAMLVAAAILVVLAVGQTFVIATAGIDLSVASTMTLGAVVLGWASSHGWNGTSPWPAHSACSPPAWWDSPTACWSPRAASPTSS